MGLLNELFGPSMPSSWLEFASEVGGRVEGDVLLVPVDELTLVVDLCSDESAQGLTLPRYRDWESDETPIAHTRLRATYVSADDFRFTIYRKPALSWVNSLIGIGPQDVEVGEPDFDKAFIIQANNRAQVTALFANPILRQWLQAQRLVRMEITRLAARGDARYPQGANELCLTVPGVVERVGQLQALYHLFVTTLQGLVLIGSAEPGAVEPVGSAPSVGRATVGTRLADGPLTGLARQEPIACFFCGRPLTAEDACSVAVALAEQAVEVLGCERHAAAVAAGERPAVRARRRGDAPVPWFHDPSFNPAWDFDPSAVGPTLAWEALPATAALFDPPPRVVVHAGDARWAALTGVAPAAESAAAPAVESPDVATDSARAAQEEATPPPTPLPDATPDASAAVLPPAQEEAAPPPAPPSEATPAAIVAVPPPAPEAAAAPAMPPADPIAAPAAEESADFVPQEPPAPLSPSLESTPSLPTVGETAANGDWAVTLQAYGPYEQFAPTLPSAPGAGRFVVAAVAVRNTQRWTGFLAPSDFSIEADGGRRFPTASQHTSVDRGFWLMQSVAAGETWTDRVVFAVDPDATGLILDVRGLRFRLPELAPAAP